MKKLFFETKGRIYPDDGKVVLLDFGHGANTKGKQSPDWKEEPQLLEWLYVREIGEILIKMLETDKKSYHIINPETKDISLKERVKRANQFEPKNSFLISLHGNAAGDGRKAHSASGIEVFTSKGVTGSDTIASSFLANCQLFLPKWKIRTDFYSDNDADKEKDFDILALTRMPAILPEMGFYTNEEECKLMNKKETKIAFAKTLFVTILEAKK